MLRTADLDYELPDELVATSAAEPRDSARLLVVRRGGAIEHLAVRDLPDVLGAGDCLVFNTSRVLPARFRGTREGTGGAVEGLYLHEPPDGGHDAPGIGRRWVVLLEAKRAKPGLRVRLGAPAGRAGGDDAGVVLTLVERAADEPGAWVVAVEAPAGMDSAAILERVGMPPLPPYIHRARRAAGLEVEQASDRARYQTVYAEAAGSVAAPTAGLHFTPELLGRLAARGIGRADVTLHVGVGTFRPVETDSVEEHTMHAEWCSTTAGALGLVRATRERGGRVVCVGTTAARTIETFGSIEGDAPERVRTRLLITPGYRWRLTDALLTNFHLPRSTLMALVAALLPGGVEQLKAVYREAVARRYRFYSYGDAMLVL